MPTDVKYAELFDQNRCNPQVLTEYHITIRWLRKRGVKNKDIGIGIGWYWLDSNLTNMQLTRGNDFVGLVCPRAHGWRHTTSSTITNLPPHHSTTTITDHDHERPWTLNISLNNLRRCPPPTMTVGIAIGWRLLFSSIMARQTFGRWLVFLSLLCLFGNCSAFVTPLLQHAKVSSSIPSMLLSTTDEASIDIESFAAPLIEIERRRNLAIISHPDSGEELVLVCTSHSLFLQNHLI